MPDAYDRMGIIGERAVRNALENYRLDDYFYWRDNLTDNYKPRNGLDARRKLVYYTVYSTRDDKALQKKEIDLIEEWMYADDMKPHKKAHEVKGELASIQKQGDGSRYDVTDQFAPLVFNYEPCKGSIFDQEQRQNGERISKTRRLHGTGNVFVELEQGLTYRDAAAIKTAKENGSGYAYVIRDTAAELERLGFDEGRDVWFAGIVYNNREIEKEGGIELPHNAEPLNNMILLAVPQKFIIDGIAGEFQGYPIRPAPGKHDYSCGYCVPFSDIYPIKKAIEYGGAHTPTGGIIWGEKCQSSSAKGARLYEETGILASFKGITEEWSEDDYKITPIVWPPIS